MLISSHDMHTGGEPLRIMVIPYEHLSGTTILEKLDYAKAHLDGIRKLVINEPRGHKDMYGAILTQKTALVPEFEVLFIHNEGFSSMCGHAIIALGRYVVDYGFVMPTSPETEVIFNCPCGPVKAFVEFSKKCNSQRYAWNCTGRVRFESVPAFVYKLGAKINIPQLGEVVIDIAFGGAFYVIVSDKALSMNLKTTALSEIVRVAGAITDAVKEKIPINHPEKAELSFLYGTIITDGNEKYADGASTNICVFADKQVDRSPTGSGVTARIALEIEKGSIALNQEKEFKSIIGSSFKGKAVRKTVQGQFPAVVVEVSGTANHTGDHTFYLESTDPFGQGFQLSKL